MDVLKPCFPRFRWVILPFLVAISVQAAERINFGTAGQTEAIQTKPIKPTTGDLPAPGLNIGNVNGNTPAPALPNRATKVARPNAEKDDQANWIFRDTQSARGIQRALGVEVFEPTAVSGEEDKTTSEVEEYFKRRDGLEQNSLVPEQMNRFDELDGSLGGIGSPGRQNGLFGSNSSRNSIPSVPVGQTGFQNTINSKNPSIRSYYRDLYRNQITPSQPVVPALDSVLNQEAEERARTRELFNRAAQIESMTPKGPSSVFENSQFSTSDDPAITQRKGRDVEAPRVERRGGQVVIPSRPF